MLPRKKKKEKKGNDTVQGRRKKRQLEEAHVSHFEEKKMTSCMICHFWK